MLMKTDARSLKTDARSLTSRRGRPDARVTVKRLYEHFGRAYEAMLAMNATPEADAGPIGKSPFDRACDSLYHIAERLIATPAHSLEEILLKIAAIGSWSSRRQGPTLAALDDWQPHDRLDGDEMSAIVSLRDDIRRLQRAAAESDARLFALDRELIEAAAAQYSLTYRVPEATDAEHTAAHWRCATLAKAIQATPARTMEGLRVKARAILWCHGGNPAIELWRSGKTATTDISLAESIIADLLADGAGARIPQIEVEPAEAAA